jgi:hypothetical protein
LKRRRSWIRRWWRGPGSASGNCPRPPNLACSELDALDAPSSALRSLPAPCRAAGWRGGHRLQAAPARGAALSCAFVKELRMDNPTVDDLARQVERRVDAMDRGETTFHPWEEVRKDLGLK